MARFDVASERPLRVAVDLLDCQIELTMSTGSDPGSSVVRIQATDLRDAQRQTAGIRSDAVRDGRDPASVTVLVDVEVMIAHDFRTAREDLARLEAELDGPWKPSSLLYVGTASGLARLIIDIRAVQAADGVTLLPLALPAVLGRIAFETLPRLESAGTTLSADKVAVLRDHVIDHRAEYGVA